MKLSTLKIERKHLDAFQEFLLTDKSIKALSYAFLFYKVNFYRESLSSNSVVYLQYPYGNLYWYIDFKRYIHNKIFPEINDTLKLAFEQSLTDLKIQIKTEYDKLVDMIKLIRPEHVLKYQLKHRLRDYQANDLLQFLIKYKFWDYRGLILSEQRTGKTRVALAALVETLTKSDVALVVCPKTSQTSWVEEVYNYELGSEKFFKLNVIKSRKTLKTLEIDEDKINIRVITYDLFKRFTKEELDLLVSKSKHVSLVCDECHRLRNFKTDQSKAIFDFKQYMSKLGADFRIIGITGTPSVKKDSDVFGILSLINNSKIAFQPTYIAFDLFKDHFYVCDNTQFGKITKALKREQELNYIIQSISVQTKQCELDFFKDYNKIYEVVELDMDSDQRRIYDEVFEHMEYDEDIDCQNKLVQLVRLQQICVDPNGLVPAYDLPSPKLKWIIDFAKSNKVQFIVSSKKTKPLLHLMQLLDSEGIEHSSLVGSYSFDERQEQIKKFKTNVAQVMLLQQDTGRESLTLPNAQCIIFLDRDFAVGFNDQAEARMTPIDGKACTKKVIDLIMKNSKEVEIYNKLVVSKESIDAMNFIFKSKED